MAFLKIQPSGTRPFSASLNAEDFKLLLRGDVVYKNDRRTNRAIEITMNEINLFTLDKILSEAVADFVERGAKK